ncbi:helix-turn-helix transcriptional regulator [Thermoplasma sp. Kam2015]|uniref:ArsR/SmtB family transcription factor n=1 Tax=Thermoplasma sp. Kam2015 TaxID=2094122 RepID=UPI0013797502|nr:winged helix-turn-helix domain-containing protein [Thermoplasma sp. Kam2015]
MTAQQEDIYPSLAPLEIKDFEGPAEIYQALSSKIRLAMIYLMKKYGKVYAQQLMEALDISQPSITSHLNKLYRSGIVTRDEGKKFTFYLINTKYTFLLEPFFREIQDIEESKKGIQL